MGLIHSKIALVEISESYPAFSRPVTVYPNRVSLNTWRGCSLKCKYCVLQFDPIEQNHFEIQRIATVETLTAAYAALCLEKPEIAQLKVTINDHSDPFLTPAITHDSIEIIRMLKQRSAAVPVVLTTKLRPPERVIKYIAENAQHLKLSVFVSVADTSTSNRVEPNNIEDRFKALQLFHAHGLHTCVYVKPLGPWTDIQHLSALIQRNASAIDDIVVSPLKGDLGAYKKYGLNIAHKRYDFGEDIENQLITTIKSHSPHLPISRKRSCAINRRNQLSCKPALFAAQSNTNTTDLFINTLPIKGYCEIHPQADFCGHPKLVNVLIKIANRLNALGVEWALIGSLQRALSGNKNLVAVGDIDIAVSKHDLNTILYAIKSQGHNPEIWMGCQKCSKNGASQRVESAIELDRYRNNIRFIIDGVQIDICNKNDNVIRSKTMVRVANVLIPVSVETVVCDPQI